MQKGWEMESLVVLFPFSTMVVGGCFHLNSGWGGDSMFFLKCLKDLPTHLYLRFHLGL